MSPIHSSARVLLLATLVGLVAPAAEARAQAPAPRPPAATLQRPSTPAGAPDRDGFIRRWLILEPIRRGAALGDSAVQAAVATEYFPGQLSRFPRDGERVTVRDTALAWHAVETDRHNVNLYHFAYALSRPTSNVLFWVATVVDAPREIPGVRLAICSNSASVWWLNGEEEIAIYNDRQSTIDDGVSRRVTLRAGPNIIRAAILNAGGATDFCARFIDEQGQPVTDLRVVLDPSPRR